MELAFSNLATRLFLTFFLVGKLAANKLVSTTTANEGTGPRSSLGCIDFILGAVEMPPPPDKVDTVETMATPALCQEFCAENYPHAPYIIFQGNSDNL